MSFSGNPFLISMAQDFAAATGINVDITMRDLITAASVVVAFIAMRRANRNAKHALRPAVENVDLTRIRDLRSELAETKTELNHVKAQVSEVSTQLSEAHDRYLALARREIEMVQYANMPGVTIEDWRQRFSQPPEAIGHRR